MKTAVIYHWWGDMHPKMNFRCPILCSIATLRQSNPDISIYVLDVTENSKHDWSKYEKLLGFKAIKYKPYFRTLGLNVDSYSMTEPSRHIDVYNFGKTLKEDVLFYSDSDVFFLKPIMPLSQLTDKITSPVFTAYFYFKKNGADAIKYIEKYKEMCTKCLKDDAYLAKLKPYCPYDVKGRRMWSEVITYYINACPEMADIKKLIKPMDLSEFANIDTAFQKNQVKKAKSFHLFYNGAKNYDEMDYVALFKEFRAPVEEMLGKTYIPEIKNVPERLSIYDEAFTKHIAALMKGFGGRPMEGFVDEAFAWARSH